MISAVVLTFNSEASIERTLHALQEVSDDIHVVDSFSQDTTIQLCEKFGCRVTQRAFENYSDQRNWAIASLDLSHSWQLHVDADEELEPELITTIRNLDLEASLFDGYIVGRKIVFMGRVLRYGSIAKTWHCRLFRSGFGRCENRLYDQHFVCDGRVGMLQAFMLDHQEDTLSEWTYRHNRWTDLEAVEVSSSREKIEGDEVLAKFRGSAIEQRRYYKSMYYRGPLFLRVFVYFLYRYIFCLGFLDGIEGLIYHFLQGFWFRFLIDAKIYERRKNAANAGIGGTNS